MTLIDTLPHYEQNWVFGLVLLVAGACLICAAIFSDKCSIVAIILVIIGLLGFISITLIPYRIKTNKKEYVMQIDDTISFNSVYNNYIILDKQPYVNIYTIMERDKND